MTDPTGRSPGTHVSRAAAAHAAAGHAATGREAADPTERTFADSVGTSVSSPQHNPWERYGWIMQTVWLVFLVFPVLSIFEVPRPWWHQVIGVALTVVFGALYVVGSQHLDRLEKACAPMHRYGALYVAVLVACAVGTMPLIGVDALSYLPFIVAFAMFALPAVWAWTLGGLCVAGATAAAIFVSPNEGTWVVAIIVLAVGVMTGAIRFMVDRGHVFESMSRELALIEERERVARDVHDVLGHSLTVVTVKAELAERLIELDPARARAELVEIQALSRQALAEIRETVGGLRVARLDDELTAARTALAGAGIAADVPADPSAVDPRCRTVLAWVLREAITNVVRHSDADECRVELDSTMLRVSDDGRGLEGRPEGNGLRGLRERVEAAGGTLTIMATPGGHGTVLEVRL